ncbi:RES family NAD+ phosphorylase [Mesorhizobium caraganae]|uniref:RES family NAD+ phosphorylase n=1 Tax=Mesorhizobium caraganae TaxID=483206 RepID=UPI001939880A|nr:RES family NAD+ phosphorylase [Mesorhizobium caraganae]MBM2716165.1 RES family NAD+ phosphorylase [Mesorhizobium caraganae]
MIFEYAQDARLFVTLPSGTMLTRARHQAKKGQFRTAADLGPPPKTLAKANRMSPPGIVVFYASEESATALAEVADQAGTFAVGVFETLRDATILDLTNLPPVPSIFWEIPDSMEYDPRPRRRFLQEVESDISRPIARDDKIHIEYVPTQIVAEYLRTVKTVDGRQVDGVRYRSTRRAGGSSIVLFADQDNVVLPPELRGDYYGLKQDRWLELRKVSNRAVSKDRVADWALNAPRW